MKKQRLAWVCMAVILLVLPSCSDDSDDGVTPELSPYKVTTQRDHVLFNLQLAYTERNVEEFANLLDDDFVFHFSVADFRDGKVGVLAWDRAAELQSAGNMFDPEYHKPGVQPISAIDLMLSYAEGDSEWDPVTPDDQDAYPGETWYKKSVWYSLICTSGYIDYTGLHIQATFTVRQTTVADRKVWRIISWEDDTEYTRSGLSRGVGSSPSTEETTWGKVKAMYLP